MLAATLLPLAEVWAQQGPPAGPPGPGEMFIKMLPLFVIVFFIFYLLVIRPQDKQMKKQQEMLAGLRKGDLVVTSGGIIAKIAQVEEDSFSLELAQNVKLRIEKAHVLRKYERPAPNKKEG
jgi:preprotein translocase subunit YajC